MREVLARRAARARVQQEFHAAAVEIQRVWRGCAARIRVQRWRREGGDPWLRRPPRTDPGRLAERVVSSIEAVFVRTRGGHTPRVEDEAGDMQARPDPSHHEAETVAGRQS